MIPRTLCLACLPIEPGGQVSQQILLLTKGVLVARIQLECHAVGELGHFAGGVRVPKDCLFDVFQPLPVGILCRCINFGHQLIAQGAPHRVTGEVRVKKARQFAVKGMEADWLGRRAGERLVIVGYRQLPLFMCGQVFPLGSGCETRPQAGRLGPGLVEFDIHRPSFFVEALGEGVKRRAKERKLQLSD